MKNKNKLIARHIPVWCKFHEDLSKDNKNCCICKEPFQCYQQGDGKVLHILCYNCYYGRIKDKSIIKLRTHNKDKE